MRKQPKARTTKAKSRIDRFYDVEERAKQKLDDASMTLQVKMSRLGGKVVEMKKVYKSYGEKQILKGFDYTFSKGERIGIVGKNGTGKTTFLQILQGLEQADSGKINLGETVVFGNFSQKGLEVKNQIRVIEYVKSFAESFPLAGGGSLSAAQFLQLFLFSPEKQYTYVHSLSGGEKKRLQLLTVLFRNPNFLILDEPTNDLDLPTLAVLEKFLIDYSGCVLLVSHDRYFMDRIVDHLFIFEGEGNVRDFPGNYSQYRLWLKAEEEKKKQEEVVEVKVEGKIVAVQAAGKSKKLSFKEKMEWETLEKDLPELEKQKAQLVIDMQQPNLSFEQMQQLADSLQKISDTLEEKEMRWLELSEKQEG
jgi:ATP-binding cassette subfamily F protein uup